MRKAILTTIWHFGLGTLIVLPTAAVLGSQSPTPGKPVALPVAYDEHRFIVQPVTVDGARLRLYTDTGGGLFLYADAAARLQLTTPAKNETQDEQQPMVTLPPFRADAWIPPPQGNNGQMPLLERRGGTSNEDLDGMLGQAWFSGRVWTFDYPGRRLLLRAPGDLPAHRDDQRVPLHFKSHENGERILDFPRIQVLIDGEAIDLLLDTGATIVLSTGALEKLADERPANRATSFISASVFTRWHRKHPEWRVIENADTTVKGEPMIEVPHIGVGVHSVGPVWFTRRADKNFHEYMSQWMDRRIEGALGGSALKFFRVTVDYPGAVAVFERP